MASRIQMYRNTVNKYIACPNSQDIGSVDRILVHEKRPCKIQYSLDYQNLRYPIFSWGYFQHTFSSNNAYKINIRENKNKQLTK